jgi:lipopolysaccharide transport system ATP-binding protein
MSSFAIQVESLTKIYKLGEIGTGTLSNDLKRWLYKQMGKPDPFAAIVDEEGKGKRLVNNYLFALNDVSFDVKEGEVVGIIGRNGAGKSTLLKILSKTTSPTSGSVTMHGKVSSLLEVGTGFHPELTGRENIFLNGAIFGMTRNEVKKKFDEIVDFSGVEAYIDTPVKRYSSGMYVRLAFSVAAHLEPDILIVDEVLAVGDAEFQKKCIGKMQDVSKQTGRTVLFVSHNMSAVMSLCSQAIVMEAGRMMFTGNVHEGVSYYLKSAKSPVAIDQRDDRKGNGDLMLHSVKIYNKEQPAQGVVSGSDIVIELGIKNISGKSFGNVEIALGVNNTFEDRVTLISNKLSGKKVSIESDSVVSIVIRKLPLAAGNYSLTSFISGDGILCDWIQNAFELQVSADLFFPQTGNKLPKEQGFFYLDFDYDVQPI